METISNDKNRKQETRRRSCTNVEDERGRQLDLVMAMTEDEKPRIELSVYQDGTRRELVSLGLSTDSDSEITIQKDGDVTFHRKFAFRPADVRLPMDLSLEKIRDATIEDPALEAVAELAREIPHLDLLTNFAKFFPVRAVLRSEDSGLLEYADGRTVDASILVDSTKVCTPEEMLRQEDLRAANCDKSWSEYLQSSQVSDYDCLLCGLILIDPCTGMPVDANAFIGCLFGPIACGVAVFIAIMLYSSSAN